ncbi:MAG TPA: MFS transporter [Candidatus Binatia bacterium]|jgi:predicted MFS family arabinose efflux permease
MSTAIKRTRVVIGLGSAQTLAFGSTYYLPAILAEPIAREFGVSNGVVFTAFSGALIMAAVLGPLVGRRIDLFGGRDVLTVSSLVFAVGLATLGAAQETVTLFAGWLVIGIGMAMGLYEAAFSTLAGIYGREARGAITGITLLAGLASTICWPISAYLETEFGWRMACFVWAGTHLVVGLPLNRFLVPVGIQRAQSATNEPAHRLPGGSRVSHKRAMPLLAFVFAVTWFTSTAMAAHLPRLLQEAGASAAAAVATAALVGPAQVAGRLVEFGFLQRFNPLLSARLAAIAHPVGALAILAFGAPAAVVFTVLHGLGNGILTIANGTLPLAIFGPSGYGLRQGFLTVPARFGQASAPFLFAVLTERFGTSALLLSAALGLASLAALLFLTPSSTAERV